MSSMRNYSNSIYGSKLLVAESHHLGDVKELKEAARALVEAASWGHFARFGRFIGDDTKEQLIQAVVDNPLIIEQLFTREGINLH
jgi:hypothetical protein